MIPTTSLLPEDDGPETGHYVIPLSARISVEVLLVYDEWVLVLLVVDGVRWAEIETVGRSLN